MPESVEKRAVGLFAVCLLAVSVACEGSGFPETGRFPERGVFPAVLGGVPGPGSACPVVPASRVESVAQVGAACPVSVALEGGPMGPRAQRAAVRVGVASGESVRAYTPPACPGAPGDGTSDHAPEIARGNRRIGEFGRPRWVHDPEIVGSNPTPATTWAWYGTPAVLTGLRGSRKRRRARRLAILAALWPWMNPGLSRMRAHGWRLKRRHLAKSRRPGRLGRFRSAALALLGRRAPQ